MRDGSDGIADWPILNALLNTASHADLVAVHGFGGQAQSAGATTDRRRHRAGRRAARRRAHERPGNRRAAARRRRLRDRHRDRQRARIGVLNMAIAPEDALGLDEAAEALDNGWTLPARWYSDPDVAELEHQRIFARSWTLLCPEAKLASTGRSRGRQLGPRARASSRATPTGKLHGFVNVCRHRAHPVAMKDGCRKLLQCRYHGWTYTLDGRLQNAPRMSREMDFDREDYSLVPVAVDTWRGFVFVNPDAAAAPLHRRPPGARAARDRAQPRLRRLEVPRALGLSDRGQLEGLRRERDRVLPLPDRAHEELQRRVHHGRERLRAGRDRRAAVSVHALQRAPREHALGRPDGRRLPLHLPLADVVLGPGRPGRVHRA